MEYRIGVDIGGTTIKAGIVDRDHKIINRISVTTPNTFKESLEALKNAVYELIENTGLSIEDFPSIGIGAPGTVIYESGRLVFSNNTRWTNVPLLAELGKCFPVPVYLENDANCAIIGETIAGAAKNKKHVIMLTLGTGVGGGIIINGKLFAGRNGLGAELGHTPVVYKGVMCTCGIRGCLEAYASATALINQTKEAMSRHPESLLHSWVKENGKLNGKAVFDCALQGDMTSIDVVDQYAAYIAAGLGGFINIFRPETIIIGGGVSNAGDFLLDKIRHKIPESAFAMDILGVPPILQATLGNDAGIIGAAFLDLMQ